MKIAAFYDNILAGASQAGCTEFEALARLKEVGLQRLYFSARSLMGKEETIMLWCRELGLEVEGVYNYFDFLHQPETAVYEDLIDTAARLGADNVLVIVGQFAPGDEAIRDTLMENARQVLLRAVAYGAQRGVTVTLEDVDQLTSPVSSIEGMQWFFEAVPGLKCSFDTGNFALRYQSELEAFELLKQHIGNVHLKDRTPDPRFPNERPALCVDGKELYTIPVGQGMIQMEELLRRLKQEGYDGSLIAELFAYGDTMTGLIDSIQWIQKIWNT